MLLLVALVALFGLAALVPFLTARLGRNAGYPLGVGFLGVGVLLGVSSSEFPEGDTVVASSSWLPSLEISLSLRLDGLSALFCLLILGVGSLIMAYCARYLSEDGRHTTVFMWLTLFAASMLGLVLADDVVLLVVFWELTTICSFVLISSAGSDSTRPAVKALLITGLGGLALLVGAVLLAVAAGTTDLSVILNEPDRVLGSSLAWPAGAMIIIAAFTKSGQLPFHSWLPGAMTAITPVSAYLHAAAMVKAGIYLLMRFSTLFANEVAWSATLIIVGLCTAVFGATWALRQHDLKALLAYSTVSQLGLLVAVIGVGTPTALTAATLHTIAHALFKATLFMLVGIIDREAGSRDVRELSGLRRVMPVTAAITGLAGLSMAGVPPLVGFVSKEYLYQGFLEADFFPGAGAVAATAAVIASALTFAYGMRIFYEAFGGPTLQRNLYEPAKSFLAPAAVPAVAGVLLGPAISVLSPVVGRALFSIKPHAEEPHLELWHGITPELAMTALALSFGIGLFLAQSRVERLLLRIPTLSRSVYERAYRHVVRLGSRIAAPDLSDSSAAFLWRPVAVLVALALAAAVITDGPPPLSMDTTDSMDWALLGLLALVVGALVLTGSVLTALAMLGIIGLIVTIWFLAAGAPDVAMTLLLVEVLTAVAIVLVISSTPTRFSRPRVPRVAGSTVLATAAGVAAAVGTLAFTGGRELSEIGDYFLHQAKAETGGENVVNTILVDFRAMDTLGESIVLGTVTLGLLLLLGNKDAPVSRRAVPTPDSVVFRVASRVVGTVMMLLSAYLFFRGHYETGGGFIAALVAGTAIAFSFLTYGRVPGAKTRLFQPGPLTAIGAVLSVSTALAASVVGEAFFTPLTSTVSLGPLSLHLSSSMLFDLGVYLIVLGLVLATLSRLGRGMTTPAVPGTPAEQDVPTKEAAS